jgi:hypothetical protein
MPKGKMKEQAKQKLRELVDRFRYNLDVYKKSTYNETQVRREFIDPFFEALGWDVSNKQGFAEHGKIQITKHQITNKSQLPISKIQNKPFFKSDFCKRYIWMLMTFTSQTSIEGLLQWFMFLTTKRIT